MGFFQPRQPAFWLYVLIVVATGLVALAEQSFYRNISASGWALSWLLLALYALPVSWSSTSWTSTSASRCRWSPRPWCGARWRPPRCRRSATSAGGSTVARVAGPIRGALDRRAHRAVRRGDPEGLRRGADLPDRARRDRRRDGRVRLRGRVRPGVRDRRGRLLLHERVRRPAGRRAAGVLPAGGGERVVLARALHRAGGHGRRGGGLAPRHRTAGPSPVDRGRSVCPGGVRPLPVELPAARLLPCRTLDRRRLADGAGRDGGQRTAVAGVRGDRGLARPASGTALVAGLSLGGGRTRRHLRRGVAGARLAQAPSRRPRPDAPACGFTGGLAAPSPPTRTGEPRHGGLQGAR